MDPSIQHWLNTYYLSGSILGRGYTIIDEDIDHNLQKLPSSRKDR